MQRGGARGRVAAAAALLLAGACQTAQTPSPAVEQQPDNSAAEAAAFAEMERQIEKEAREKREAQLREIFDKANLLEMDSDERARVKCAAMAEVARIRFHLGDVRGATEAIEKAIETAQVAGNRTLEGTLLRDRFVIGRFAALEISKSDHGEALRMYDRLLLIPGLTAQMREQLGGDRLVIMELGGNTEQRARDAAYMAALARILGSGVQATPSLNGNGNGNGHGGYDTFALSSEDLRRSIGDTIGRDVGEAALPDMGPGPVAETGQLDGRSVMQVVASNKASVTICYNRSLKQGERLGGKLEMKVTVEPDGTVSKAEPESAKFRGTSLAECIQTSVLRWRFPPFDGKAAEVVVPFVLSETLSL